MAHRQTRVGPVVATVLAGCALLVGTLSVGGAASATTAAQAKKYLLVLSDMPKGWKSEGAASTGGGSSSFPGAKQLASCIGVASNLITANPPEANSPYFQNKNGSLEVQDTVTVFPSVKKANSEFGAIANAKTPSCVGSIMNTPSFKSQLTSSGGEGASVGTITVSKINSSLYGPHTAGVTIGIPISSQGVNVSAKVTVVFYVKGNLGQQLSFNSYNTSFPISIAHQLTVAALNRL